MLFLILALDLNIVWLSTKITINFNKIEETLLRLYGFNDISNFNIILGVLASKFHKKNYEISIGSLKILRF